MGARNAQDTHLQKKNRIYRKKKNELPKNTIITTTEKKREKIIQIAKQNRKC